MSIVHQRLIADRYFVTGVIGTLVALHLSTASASGFALSEVLLDRITAGAASQTVEARANAKGALPIAATLTSSNVVTSGTFQTDAGVSGALGIGVAIACCEQSLAEVDIATGLSGSNGIGFDHSRLSQSITGMTYEISAQAAIRFGP